MSTHSQPSPDNTTSTKTTHFVATDIVTETSVVPGKKGEPPAKVTSTANRAFTAMVPSASKALMQTQVLPALENAKQVLDASMESASRSKKPANDAPKATNAAVDVFLYPVRKSSAVANSATQ